MQEKQDKIDNLVRERCKLETKYWKVYQDFTPNYKKPLLASKLFSKHEAGAFDADPEVLNRLKRAKDLPAVKKMEWPECENQWYGWFIAPLTDRDRRDPLMYFARSSTEISRIGVKILAERKLKH